MKYYGRLTKNEWFLYAYLLNHENREQAEQLKQKVLVKRNYKYKNCQAVNPWKIVVSDSYGYTMKRFFKGPDFRPDEWADFINHEWRTTGTAFDCSGRLFTVDIERYTVPGGVWVYHKLAIDC